MSNSLGDIPQFCRVMGHEDPFEAVRVKASQVRMLVDGPPFEYDDPRVCDALGVQIKYIRGLTLDGRVFRSGSGFRVEINSSKPRTRQRFTLAHELAHTFFMFPGGDTPPSRPNFQGRDDLEEELCDFAATELLMPTAAIARILADDGPSIGTLLRISETFKVSLSAAANRITRLLPKKCHIGFWRFSGSEARYESGFFTPKLTIALPPGCILDPALLQKAQESKGPVQQNADLGFISGRTQRLGRTFVQAFSLPTAQMVVTFTVFAKHSRFLLQRFSANRYADLFERLRDASYAPQLQLFE